MAAVLGRVYEADWFGAVGDGTTDDTVAIQRAITAASGASGGRVNLSEKTYKVSTLTLPAGVHIAGTHVSDDFNVTGSGLYVTGNGIQPAGDGCGVRGVVFSGSGAYHVYAPNGANGFTIRDTTMVSPGIAGIFAQGSCQFWDIENLVVIGGQYAIYMPSNGVTVWASTHCRNVTFTAQTHLAAYFKFDQVTNGVVWDGLTIHFLSPGPGQAGGGIKIDSTGHRADGWVFIGFNAEFVAGQTPNMNAYTTCSGAAGDNHVTLTAKTGSMPDGTPAWVTGQTVTIASCGYNGADFRGVITAVSGLALTLDTPLPVAAVGASITPYVASDIEMVGSATFINPSFGSSAGTRYALDASGDVATNAGAVTIFGAGLSQGQPRPIYDPYCRVQTWNNLLPIRRTSANPAPTDRYWLAHTTFEALAFGSAVLESVAPRRSQIASPGGGDIRLVLLDSNANGTGSVGRLLVTSSVSSDGTDVMSVDSHGTVLVMGGLGLWGKSAPTSQPIAVTSPASDTSGTKSAIDQIRAVLAAYGLTQ